MSNKDVIRLSWSGLTKYLSCQRSYELSQVEQLERIPTSTHKPRFLGSAVHAGIEGALRDYFHTGNPGNMLQAALNALTVWLSANTAKGRMVYDWQLKTNVSDMDYYDMVDAVRAEAKAILKYYVPRLGIGTLYDVATLQDIGVPNGKLEPALEHKFEYALVPGKVVLTGIIDAALKDKATGEIMLFDWKTRERFLDADMIALDGQLQLYAAVLNNLARQQIISRVHQVQIRSTPPKPAEITDKTRVPSKASQLTTWDEWVRTLPEGLNPAHYEKDIRPKVKPDSHFLEIVQTPVTFDSEADTLDQALKVARAIAYSRDKDQYPAIYSGNTCRYCDFKALCLIARNGGDVSMIVREKYQKKSVLTAADTPVYDE